MQNAQNKKKNCKSNTTKYKKELKEIESLIKENKQERSNYLGQLNSIKTKINCDKFNKHINEQNKPTERKNCR
ncbi:MAG: hypothetical protein R2836_02010 [Chitinophagales bacterium]